MNERPAPPPEGQLITAALAKIRPKLTLREAARRAGISEARWRQIATGYVMVNGQPSSVVGPPETVARMARAVGLKSRDLRKEGQRPDAANELQDLELAEEYGLKTSAELDEESMEILTKIHAAIAKDREGIDEAEREVTDMQAAGLAKSLAVFRRRRRDAS